MIFLFANGIEQKLAKVLENIGIVVKGQILKDSDDTDLEHSPEVSSKCNLNISKVNLDVSAMLAYVSSVTNGSCDKYHFSVPVLSQQAKWECERPQKPILDNFFKGNLVFTATIIYSFFLSVR